MATRSHLNNQRITYLAAASSPTHLVSRLASPHLVQLAIPDSFPWLSLTELVMRSGRGMSLDTLTTTDNQSGLLSASAAYLRVRK